MAKKQINNAINKESMFKKIMPSAAHAVVKPPLERKRAPGGAEELQDDLMDDLIEQSVGSFGDDLLEQLPSSRRIFAAPAAPTAPVPPPPAAAPEPPEGYLIGSPDPDDAADSPPPQKSHRATPRARARQAAQHAQHAQRTAPQYAGLPQQPADSPYPPPQTEQQPYSPYPPQNYGPPYGQYPQPYYPEPPYAQQPYPQQSYQQPPYPQQPNQQQPYSQQSYPQPPNQQQPYPQQSSPQQPYSPQQYPPVYPPYSPEQPVAPATVVSDSATVMAGTVSVMSESQAEISKSPDPFSVPVPENPLEEETVHQFQPMMDFPSDTEEPEDYNALPPLRPESEDIVNVMEQVVLSHIEDAIHRMRVCTCDKCRSDIAAYALNHLAAQYVLSEELDEETLCRRGTVAAAANALYRAAIRVKTFPRHDS